jgi:hypothetical protein
MPARKSAEVKEAVDLVISGKVKTAYAAAKQMGVAESSIARDPRYRAWRKARKERLLK